MAKAATAALLCGSALPAAAFVVPASAPSSGVVALRGHAESQQSSQSNVFSRAAAVGGLSVVAGLVALQRRQSRTARGYVRPGMGHIDNTPRVMFDGWSIEPQYPVPGSEKALATMVGADVETGSKPWDPMGFSKLYDRNFEFNMTMTYPHVEWHRESELKHGRICMLAIVGMVAQHFVQLPAPWPAEPDWTKALAECYQIKYPCIGLVQISLFIMLVEGKFFPGAAWIGQLDREPGDLGFDPLKFSKKDKFDLKSMQLKELKNGRLAMIGVASLVSEHMQPGSVPLLTGLFA